MINRILELTLEDWLAMCITTLVFLLGEVNDSMIAFMLLLFIDYLTGVRKAWKQRNLSSTIGRKGLEKKAFIMVVIIVAHMLDKVLGVAGDKVSFRTGAMLAYSCNEALSILENLRAVGTWVPSILEDKLLQVHRVYSKGGKPDSKPCDDCPNMASHHSSQPRDKPDKEDNYVK